ncbi:MAG: hypothetical protein HQ567_34895 [Candidatus Nealsonbacteria bacterium]|nr:hypothetical protein [Candidatus Nealsonbacteria bacterium]
MHDHHTDEAWGGEDPATLQQAGNSRSAANEGFGGPHILARMPDLETETLRPERASARSEGRLISRRLATRLLVGGGILLMLAAVVPWWLGRTVEGEGGKAIHPNAPPAPLFDAQAAQQSDKKPTRLQPQQPPDLSLDIQVPEGGLDFMNMPSPGNANPGKSAAPPSQPPRPIDVNIETGRWDRLPEQPTLQGERPAHRVSGLPTRRTWDIPSPAGAGYPSPPPRAGSFEAPPNVSHGLMPDPADQRVRQPPTDLIHPQAAVNRPMSIGMPGPVQPGIARLEGIIQDPPVRTTYDRNRQGVH